MMANFPYGDPYFSIYIVDNILDEDADNYAVRSRVRDVETGTIYIVDVDDDGNKTFGIWSLGAEDGVRSVNGIFPLGGNVTTIKQTVGEPDASLITPNRLFPDPLNKQLYFVPEDGSEAVPLLVGGTSAPVVFRQEFDFPDVDNTGLLGKRIYNPLGVSLLLTRVHCFAESSPVTADATITIHGSASEIIAVVTIPSGASSAYSILIYDWGHVSGNNGYKVERKIGAGAFTEIVSSPTAQNATSATDTITATASTQTVIYRVTALALDSENDSAPSPSSDPEEIPNDATVATDILVPVNPGYELGPRDYFTMNWDGNVAGNDGVSGVALMEVLEVA
jgi:hypothetical protein